MSKVVFTGIVVHSTHLLGLSATWSSSFSACSYKGVLPSDWLVVPSCECSLTWSQHSWRPNDWGSKRHDMYVVYRARDTAAREKAAAAESKEKEEELQASSSRLQKQIDKAVAERNSAEGRSQRSAASLLKVKADLAALEIKMQVMHLLLVIRTSTTA